MINAWAICELSLRLSLNHGLDVDLMDKSPTYIERTLERTAGKRLAECFRLLRHIDEVDAHVPTEKALNTITTQERLWVLATSIRETGLRNDLVSSSGARSSMQTYRKYAPCKRCDLRIAGIYHAISLYRKHDTCNASAKYNAGPKGDCNGVGGEYAQDVMTYFEMLCEKADVICEIHWGC